jgi:acyl carrier protein
MATRTSELEGFIRSELLQGSDTTSLDEDTDLLGTGIVDSHGIMEIVAFLQERHGIAISDDDLTPERFGTIAAIERFVAERTGSC